MLSLQYLFLIKTLILFTFTIINTKLTTHSLPSFPFKHILQKLSYLDLHQTLFDLKVKLNKNGADNKTWCNNNNMWICNTESASCDLPPSFSTGCYIFQGVIQFYVYPSYVNLFEAITEHQHSQILQFYINQKTTVFPLLNFLNLSLTLVSQSLYLTMNNWLLEIYKGASLHAILTVSQN